MKFLFNNSMVFYKAIYAKTEEKGFHDQQYFSKSLVSLSTCALIGFSM